MLTSDSESEIFCDSLDSVEQLVGIKVKHPADRGRPLGGAVPPQLSNDFCPQHQMVRSNGFHNGHATESARCDIAPLDSQRKFRQVGAGQGGEGADDGRGPGRRGRDAGRDASHHNWRDRKSERLPGIVSFCEQSFFCCFFSG